MNMVGLKEIVLGGILFSADVPIRAIGAQTPIRRRNQSHFSSGHVHNSQQSAFTKRKHMFLVPSVNCARLHGIS
jgi:hypothetical protein